MTFAKIMDQKCVLVHKEESLANLYYELRTGSIYWASAILPLFCYDLWKYMSPHLKEFIVMQRKQKTSLGIAMFVFLSSGPNKWSIPGKCSLQVCWMKLKNRIERCQQGGQIRGPWSYPHFQQHWLGISIDRQKCLCGSFGIQGVSCETGLQSR